MREKIEIKFDHLSNLVCYIWKNDSASSIGTVQLSHGMAEHILRYDEFANYLVSLGYTVIGHDHYAHGLSSTSCETVGETLEYDFMDAILKGMKLVRDEFSSYFIPGKSYLFAHSMGAMATLRYLELYPNDFDKAILSGPDGFSFKYNMAKVLTSLFNKKNKIVYSPFVLKLSTGSFNKKFTQDDDKFGWLSSKKDSVLAYKNDPYCGKDFPVNYFNSLSKMMVVASKSKNIELINKNLKIYLYSGELDPVNNYHKSLITLTKLYKKHNLNVLLKSYKGARHEVHNEIDSIKHELYEDIKNFLKEEVK